MEIDTIVGVFQRSVEEHSVTHQHREAMCAAIPILRRAKEVDVELLKRVVEHKRKWEEAGITGPESEAESAAASAYQLVLDYLEYPEELQAEAKRLGLEVEE